MVPTTIRRR